MEYLPEADSNGSYINESERNVHVWCSIVRPCTYDSKNLINKPTLGLIAGKLCVCIRTYLVSPLSSRLLCTQWGATCFRVLYLARQNYETRKTWSDVLDHYARASNGMWQKPETWLCSAAPRIQGRCCFRWAPFHSLRSLLS